MSKYRMEQKPGLPNAAQNNRGPIEIPSKQPGDTLKGDKKQPRQSGLPK